MLSSYEMLVLPQQKWWSIIIVCCQKLIFYPYGSVPHLGLANAPIVETKFLELAMSLLDFSPRIPLGTFSILLIKSINISVNNVLKHTIPSFNASLEISTNVIFCASSKFCRAKIKYTPELPGFLKHFLSLFKQQCVSV